MKFSFEKSPGLLKSLVISCVTFAALTIGLPFLAYRDRSPLIIESDESTNLDGKHVINKISWRREGDNDIWLMKQSHHGIAAKEWDRLKIVVDTQARRAEFLQLDADDKPTSYRVSCYLCHSNGPRAIRPLSDNTQVHLNAWDRLRLFTWNLKIKSYGPLAIVDSTYGLPVRWLQAGANEMLKVKTCVHCHNSDSRFGRSSLTKQNFLAIRFMLEQGHMPPWPYKLLAKDRAAVLEFIH